MRHLCFDSGALHHMFTRCCCRGAAPRGVAVRPWPSRCHASPSIVSRSGISFGAGERVVDVERLLAEVDVEATLLLSDDDDNEPVWEHEARFQGTGERHSDALSALSHRPPTPVPEPPPEEPMPPSAYSSEGGFRTITAAELAAGGADLLLDVRTDTQHATGAARHAPVRSAWVEAAHA